MKPSLLAALIAALGVGCSAGDGREPADAPYAGGQTGSGGQAAFGGQTAPGGQNAMGGLAAAGGWIGAGGITSGGLPGISTGGDPSSGGVPGSGGGSDTGGLSATGGLPGAGGSATGGAPPAAGGTPPNDAGSGGGPATYHPCPTDGTPCKILPFGDSITWGIGDEADGGYRGPLFARVVAAQQKITFTGSLSNGPNTVSGQLFPKKNEGHSGYGISTVTQYSNGVAGIATAIPNPAFAAGSGGLPDIVLLLIGTNDTGNTTSAVMTERLAALVDKIIAGAPDALLVIAKITPMAWANAVINPYNDAMPGLVQTRAAAGKHVMLADMNTGFAPTMMGSDGIHPNRAGYEFMADRWYSVIGPLLPK